jgi:hypothetical protein
MSDKNQLTRVHDLAGAIGVESGLSDDLVRAVWEIVAPNADVATDGSVRARGPSCRIELAAHELLQHLDQTSA